jgi:mono/diheme cytochrome c family protein
MVRLLCFVAIAAVLGLAQEGGGRGNTREFLGLGTPPDAPAAARGEKIYKSNCGFCHGEKARGAEGPNLVRSAVVLHDEKGDQIGPLVAKGAVDRGMPAFPNFTKEQLYDISQYLHLQVELVANRGLYKRLNVVTGDPQKGEAYFNTACKSCHSVTGDLAHVGSKQAPDQLQSRFVWPAARGNAKRQVTVKLASGEVVKGTLKQLDDVNVSMFDSTGTYRSWPVTAVKVEIEDRLAGHRALLDKYTDADLHNLTAYLVTFK